MGSRRLPGEKGKGKDNRTKEPIEIKNTEHTLKDHKINRKSGAKLTYDEAKGKVKVAFHIAEYQKFSEILIYQNGNPKPPSSILPELPMTDENVTQLYKFRQPDVGHRWAMFLMDFNPVHGFNFKSEYTLLPYYHTLLQTVVILVTYANREFKDTPSKNYFDTSVTFQGSTILGTR